jgi:hypothetical protein
MVLFKQMEGEDIQKEGTGGKCSALEKEERKDETGARKLP